MTKKITTTDLAESFAAVADNEDGFKEETVSEIKAQLESILSERSRDADPNNLPVEVAIDLHREYIARNKIEDDIRGDEDGSV